MNDWILGLACFMAVIVPALILVSQVRARAAQIRRRAGFQAGNPYAREQPLVQAARAGVLAGARGSAGTVSGVAAPSPSLPGQKRALVGTAATARSAASHGMFQTCATPFIPGLIDAAIPDAAQDAPSHHGHASSCATPDSGSAGSSSSCSSPSSCSGGASGCGGSSGCGGGSS